MIESQIYKAVATGMVAFFVTFGIAQAQTADPTTASFALSDEDGDGVVNVEEYRARMIVVLVSLDENEDGYLVEAEIPEGHKDLLAVADTNGDGKVDIREHLLFVMPRFWKADYDGDNVLSLPEVIAADKREAANKQ